MSVPPPPQMIKKRKMAHRDSSFGDGIDMQRAMGMAMEMGLTAEEEGEEMMTMSDEQMVCRSPQALGEQRRADPAA